LAKVGVIGCGAIGNLVAKAFEDRLVKCEELILFDNNFEKAEKLQHSLHIAARAVRSIEEMIEAKPAIIVEAASQQAVRQYGPKIIAQEIELIVMSVGGLLGLKVQSNKIHVPSGAIGGLDAISSAVLAGVVEVILTTRKNPRTLNMNNEQEKTVYEGGAEEAVRLFPREINVAATLALAVRPENVKVKVISDPEVQKNVHEIKVFWKHGDMFLRFRNDPHPENPGSSALAAWSALRLLKELLERAG
jgi:aspartate dehydrogenase